MKRRSPVAEAVLCWVDGDVLDEAEAAVPAADRALAYGDGLFETILVVRGRPIWMAAHLTRFRRSAKELGFRDPSGLARRGVVAARALTTRSSTDRAALRITWTRGSGMGGFAPPSGASVRVLARLAPLAERHPGGVRAITLPDLHASSLARHKSCSAFLYVEAARRAQAAGVEEALLSDGRGGVAEASAANLFAVVDETLVTPPDTLPLLPGVTRAWVLREAGVQVAQHALHTGALARASEAFLTNSLSGVVPLLEVDGRRLGSGRPGPLTQRLAAAFAAETNLR